MWTCFAVAGAAVVMLGMCGGCLYLGLLGDDAARQAEAETRQSMIEAAKAAVVAHFRGEVTIVTAAADRPTDTGLFIAGKYQRPGDRVRDFLATVVQTDQGCRVQHLIVDGTVVIPRPD